MTRTDPPSPKSLGEPIARGRTAEIFALNESEVLKLFFAWCPKDWAGHELTVAGMIQTTGLAMPAIKGPIEMEGRPGLIYQRVHGPSMLAHLRDKPWLLVSLAGSFAELHSTINAHTVSDLPAWHERMENTLRQPRSIPEDLAGRALALLGRLPDGDRLCHGDFHPDNIIMSPRGPVIIDWINAARGNPLADVARSSLLMRLGEPPPRTPMRPLLNMMRSTFLRAYLRHYAALRPFARGEYESWLFIQALLRLREEIPGEREHLLALAASMNLG